MINENKKLCTANAIRESIKQSVINSIKFKFRHRIIYLEETALIESLTDKQKKLFNATIKSYDLYIQTLTKEVIEETFTFLYKVFSPKTMIYFD